MTRKHKSIVAFNGSREYAVRSYVLGKLDIAHIKDCGDITKLLDVNGYCLDALDELPAGYMHAGWINLPLQGYVQRGVSLQEVKEKDEAIRKIVDELDAEIGGGI